MLLQLNSTEEDLGEFTCSRQVVLDYTRESLQSPLRLTGVRHIKFYTQLITFSPVSFKIRVN